MIDKVVRRTIGTRAEEAHEGRFEARPDRDAADGAIRAHEAVPDDVRERSPYMLGECLRVFRLFGYVRERL